MHLDVGAVGDRAGQEDRGDRGAEAQRPAVEVEDDPERDAEDHRARGGAAVGVGGLRGGQATATPANTSTGATQSSTLRRLLAPREELERRRPLLGRPRVERAGQHDRQRVLGQRREHHRREQRVEHAAQRPADGDPEVELGQPLGVRAVGGQLAVADQRDREQHGEVQDHQDHSGRWRPGSDDVHEDHGQHRHRQAGGAGERRGSGPRRESDHERRQVQRSAAAPTAAAPAAMSRVM